MHTTIITIQGQNFVEVSKEIEQFLLLRVKENESAIKNANSVFKFGTVVSKNAKQRGRKPTPKRKRTERPEPLFECDICEKDFYSLRVLMNHKQKEHIEEEKKEQSTNI